MAENQLWQVLLLQHCCYEHHYLPSSFPFFFSVDVPTSRSHSSSFPPINTWGDLSFQRDICEMLPECDFKFHFPDD